MEAAALLLLLALCVTSDANFYGNSITITAPKRNKNGTLTLSVHHRQNGRKVCGDPAELKCEGGACSSLRRSGPARSGADDTARGRWCQSESITTATIPTTKSSVALRSSGCCWLANMEGKTAWTSVAELDLGVRSDRLEFNRCPVTATVAWLRVPQDCFWSVPLLAHDPDGDHVKCSFAADAAVPLNVSLDEATCTLTRTGQVEAGVHVFELMLEDFPATNITLSYADGTRERRDLSSAPLCRVKLQFSVEVLPPVRNCRAGRSLPVFLSPTPPHLSVLHATVGQKFQLTAAAQAPGARVGSFQVSGPSDMNKTFTEGENGRAQVTLSWVPQQQDARRSAPLCFTAETNTSQSEMRCVVVMVTQSTHRQGQPTLPEESNILENGPCLDGRVDGRAVIRRRGHHPVPTKQDHGDAGEGFHARPGHELPEAQRPHLLADLQPHPHHRRHVFHHLRNQSPGGNLHPPQSPPPPPPPHPPALFLPPQEDGDYLVFTNAITSFQLPNEVIVRRRSVNIDFSCRFPKLLSVSSSFNVHDSDYVFTQSNFGTFGYRFDIYDDGNFSSKVQSSAYPVSVKLLQTLYMGIQAQSELPNVQIFVESCKGTPDDNSDNPIYYDLIKDGCAKDETLRVHPSKQTTFNFEVQSFKFSDYDQVRRASCSAGRSRWQGQGVHRLSPSQVYITCYLMLCDSDSLFSRCAQGCVKSPARRRRRGLSLETERHSVIQGPL
ncbi:unnamed protein product, partial [Tetraodon nigroviridis]